MEVREKVKLLRCTTNYSLEFSFNGIHELSAGGSVHATCGLVLSPTATVVGDNTDNRFGGLPPVSTSWFCFAAPCRVWSYTHVKKGFLCTFIFNIFKSLFKFFRKNIRWILNRP